jgi:putative DNA primase/helicase
MTTDNPYDEATWTDPFDTQLIDKPSNETPGEDKPASAESMDAVVDRLAKLSPLEYDKVRQAEAKALKVRSSTLDAAVTEVRKKAQVSQDMFAEVEPWQDEVKGFELLDEISTTIKRYIVMPNHAPETVALWIMNTYVHDASYHNPMILITSPEKRCGKTNLLTLIDELSNRSLMTGNITAAAVYRAIEMWKPTLLIDEADTFLKQNDDMAGVINSGHTKKSAFVIRCDGDTNEPKRFSTWCPKVIAGIGSQRDTLEDRSIIVPLRRKLNSDSVARLRLDRTSFDDIQSKCVRWAVDNFQAVRNSDPATPKGLHDRAADNWTPLFAIADLCGWREKAELAAMALSGADDSESIETILLKDIRDIFKAQNTDRLSSQQLCDLLAAIDDRPWAEWSRGKPITTNRLAGRLKMFGIHSGSVRLPNGENLKGYKLDSFKDAFIRYVAVQSVTTSQVNDANGFSDIQSVTTTDDVTFQKAEKVNDTNGCDVVTVQNTESANSVERGQEVAGSLRI